MIFFRSSITTLLLFVFLTTYSQVDSKLVGSWKLYSINKVGTLSFTTILTFRDSAFEQRTMKSGGEITVDQGDYEVHGNKLILKTRKVTGLPDTIRFDDRNMTYELKKNDLIIVEQFEPKNTREKQVVYETHYFRKTRLKP
jgi:hypothetical protein